MITTITMNPALDKTIRTDGLIYGEVNRVGNFREDLGGKGLNVGRVLNGFGVPTMNLAFIGEENRHKVIEYIKKDAMAFDYVSVPGHTRTNIKVVEMAKNMTTDINEEGITINREDYAKMMAKLEGLSRNSSFIVMSGSLAPGIPETAYGNITRLYKKNSKMVVDASGEVLKATLGGQPFMIKPNLHELGSAVGREIEDEEEAIIAAKELIEQYGITYIIVSMGEHGAILVTTSEVYKADALPVTVVSTVGAGDAMLAGFIFALTRKKTLEECLAFGTACSALTIAVDGYPILNIDEVYEKARQVKVTLSPQGSGL